MSSKKVFVYGTLKKGEGNYHRLLSSSEYIGPNVTKEKYILGDVGVPYLFSKEAGLHHFDEDHRYWKQVAGDVFTVNEETFAALDRLEGYPVHYNRMEIELVDGQQAWVYYQEEPYMMQHCTECNTTDEGYWTW